MVNTIIITKFLFNSYYLDSNSYSQIQPFISELLEYLFMRNGLISGQFPVVSKSGDALKISVRFFTSLREIVGKREEMLEFSENEKVTVNKVLLTLGQVYGKTFIDYVYDARSSCVKGFLQFFINGRSAATLNGLESELADGDVLAIIPPVGGG